MQGVIRTLLVAPPAALITGGLILLMVSLICTMRNEST